MTALVVLFSLILNSLFIIPASVYAASSPWTQTDWSGGVGASTTNQYSAASSTDATTTANQVTLTQTSSWYNASWAYRKKITFDNSSQAENLTNFPVLVKLSSSNFDFSKAQSAGQDIRFTDSDGTTALSYEIESYSNSSSTASIWVKVPQIDLSSATDNIYIYYGNSSATDGQAATSVWDSNYKGVWHSKDVQYSDVIGSLTFQERVDDVFPVSTRPHMQGVASDGTYLYIAQDDQIKKLNKSDYSLVASHNNPHLDGTDMSQVNNVFVYGDYLYLGANNYDNVSKQGYIKVFNKSDLSYVEEHQVKNFWSEGASFYDNSWWVVYFDYAYVSRYDTNWNFIADYPLRDNRGNSQGIIWIGDYLYVPTSSPNLIEVYKWDGNNVNYFTLISLPAEMTSPINGIGKEPNEDVLWISELYYNTDHNNLIKTAINFGATNLNDSTSNLNYGLKLSTEVDGKISKAQSFNGTSNFVSVSNSSSLQVGSTFTISAWINAASLANRMGIFSTRTANSAGSWQLEVGPASGGTNRVAVTGVGTYIKETTDNAISTGAYYYITYTRSSNSDTGTIYINGSAAAINQSNSYTVSNNSNDKEIGRGTSGTHYFTGQIDEVRISNIVRSAAWIAAEYKTENDTFNTFASEEQEYPSSGTLTSSIFDTEFTDGAAWGTLTYTATTPTNTTVTVKARTSNDSGMSGATVFSSCNAITSGSDISSNNCVTDTQRYIQYQLTLANSSVEVTPTFSDISITFANYDGDAPSISLTALSPDPNSDNTPTFSGTATDSIGTVSNVQFQMDSTSGSWTACTATDGSFNSASEAFSCTAATLTDGSRTMYVRATDSNGNTTSSSYATDTFTIDATNPVSIDLDSPGDNSYTNSERPTFKWKATSDATAGLSKYVLEIDNPSIGSSQPSGDFTIDNIPTSGTTDITSNNKYVIHFENFNDSDSTNNYISVYTRSTNDWGSSENDGKLREGRISWKVKAVDNAGNEGSSSRTLFVDRTNPNVEFTQVNSTPFSTSSNSNFSTTDKTPTIFGKITDPLAGGDPSQTQSESGPRVASGPKQVDIKIEKKDGLGYKLITLYTINMADPYYTCEEGKTIDNSKQKCDKYVPFEYTPKENLDFGTYKVTVTGKDKADNSSSETVLTLNITTLAKITTSEEKQIIEEETKELEPEEKEQIKEELEITKPTEEVPVSTLEKAGENITHAGQVVFQETGNLITTVFTGIGNGIAFVFDKTGQGLAFIFNKTGEGLAFVGNGIGTGINNIASAIGSGYSNIAEHAPGITKNIMLAIGNGFSSTGNFIVNTANNIGTGIHNTGTAIAKGFNNTTKVAKEGTANIIFAVGEKSEFISNGVSIAIVKFGYLFATEPTVIYDVKVVVLSSTSAKISWHTNHPASGKVNYGLNETYPLDIQTDKRTGYHEFTLTNLAPHTEYHFEVMSQNKNYVYDANRKFTTPAK